MSVQPSVAVVVPRYRLELQAEEEQALKHLDAFLGGYDRFFITPKSLRPEWPGVERRPFPDDYFTSIEAYSRLLLSTFFYRAFQHYRFILIYQLDSLVFADRLAEWCKTEFDYVGAPWLVDPTMPEKGFSRVGNGGFCLRRVASCLRVLESRRYLERRVGYLRDILRAPLPDLAPHRLLKRVQVLREARRGIDAYASSYSLNEDRFWSDRARLFWPGFRVAPVKAALSFSFERAPDYCFQQNGSRQPFGCHAWQRWDHAFWEPHLIR